MHPLSLLFSICVGSWVLFGFSYTQNRFLDSCSIYYALAENVASVASYGLLKINKTAPKTQDKQSEYE